MQRWQRPRSTRGHGSLEMADELRTKWWEREQGGVQLAGVARWDLGWEGRAQLRDHRSQEVPLLSRTSTKVSTSCCNPFWVTGLVPQYLIEDRDAWDVGQSSVSCLFQSCGKGLPEFLLLRGVVSNALFYLKWFLERIWGKKKTRKYHEGQVLNGIWAQISSSILALWKTLFYIIKRTWEVFGFRIQSNHWSKSLKLFNRLTQQVYQAEETFKIFIFLKAKCHTLSN